MGCMFNPAASTEIFPSDITNIHRVELLDGYNLVANWPRGLERYYATTGAIINKIEVYILTNAFYAYTSANVKSLTRVSATITSPDNAVIFTGFLNEIGMEPGRIPEDTGRPSGVWKLSYIQHFDDHTLVEDEYTITILYELSIAQIWTEVETTTFYLGRSPTPPPADIPVEYSVWLPVMLSFAVIVGMAFIGFNLTRDRSPSPAPVLFMLFVGVVLTWSFGWLPPWVFITAIALLSLASAILWGKMFKGR